MARALMLKRPRNARHRAHLSQSSCAPPRTTGAPFFVSNYILRDGRCNGGALASPTVRQGLQEAWEGKLFHTGVLSNRLPKPFPFNCRSHRFSALMGCMLRLLVLAVGLATASANSHTCGWKDPESGVYYDMSGLRTSGSEHTRSV